MKCDPIRQVLRGFQRHIHRRIIPLGILAFNLVRNGRPEILISYGKGLGGGAGDHLLCTSVIAELHKRGTENIWVMSDRTELFLHNHHVRAVIPERKRLFDLVRSLGSPAISVEYTHHIKSEDRDIPPQQHIIATMCALAKIQGEVSIRPYLELLETEKQRGKLLPRQVAIQSSGLAAPYPMRNKEWYPERYQEIVARLAGAYSIVQIGSRSDPLLEGALDLRGATSIRETAAILSQSLLFIGQVGFLMHLARAVNCRSVIIYGGREWPSQTGYICNENLYSTPPCAPCWMWNSCNFDRICMQIISASQVLEAVKVQLERTNLPLEVEVIRL